jgi:para-nitrobenzyl esterase
MTISLTGVPVHLATTLQGLPDTPLRMMEKGQINTSPEGKPIHVLMGTNADEMSLFLVLMGVIVGDGLEVPPVLPAHLPLVAAHLVKYHDNWDAGTARAIEAAYPIASYATETVRMIAMTTDLAFRCGTRRAARALAAAGIDTYLYSFEFKSNLYKDPASPLCTADAGFGCGVYHSAEVKYVFNTYAGTDPNGRQVADIMGVWWTNLAKYGTPNSPRLPEKAWPEYTVR